MSRWLLAGAAYFAIVFAAAFALGALRVTFIVPAVGSVWATVIELPFTLLVSWMVCGWVLRFLEAPSLGQAVAMGASAFGLLMTAETIGALALFDRSLNEYVGSFATVAGALGLAGQIAFGLFPLARRRSVRSPLTSA